MKFGTLLLSVLFILCAGCARHDVALCIPNTKTVFLTNTSVIDFSDLTEMTTRYPEGFDKKHVNRFEGFLEEVQVGQLSITKLDPDECLSPEAEWVLFFPAPEQLKKAFDGKINWEDIDVQLTGMIEGKRLNKLMETKDSPPWLPASKGNNVIAVSQKDQKTSVPHKLKDYIDLQKELEGNVVVFRKLNDGRPAEEYRSPMSDIAHLPLQHIVISVVKEFEKTKRATGNLADAQLVAINLGSQGDSSALVNETGQTKFRAASTAFFSYLNPFSYSDLPLNIKLRTMHFIAKNGIDSNKCLQENESFIVKVYAGPNENDESIVGTAELRYGNE
jgi:hypothetical protein